MNIVIIGAGFTGVELARKLINEKNQVVLIDNDKEVVDQLSNRLDCTVLQDDGNNLENLEEAGISKADALVAVTDNDEINMITCSMVDAVYPNLLKIARVRNYSYYVNQADAQKKHAATFSKNHRPLYGIDYMIHPDVEAAEAIVKAVEHGAISDVLTFGNGEFELAALNIEKNSRMDGIKLKDARLLSETPFIVTYVETPEGTDLPDGNTILHAGDRIGILTGRDNIKHLIELCGSRIDALKKIVMVGAGRIGTIVADHLIERRKNSFLKKIFGSSKKLAQEFYIVDSDRELCDEASKRFPEAKVFLGDITDEGFIQEEGLDKFNLIICATHNHELNMVVSAYLESLGVEKSVALVAHSDFAEIARKIGVDVAVPLRDTVVDSIMSHLRGQSVTEIHTVSNGELELIECDLSPKSKFAGKSLKDIANPGEYLLLLVKKPGTSNYELTTGKTVLSPGDHLVIIQRAGNKKVLAKFSGE